MSLQPGQGPSRRPSGANDLTIGGGAGKDAVPPTPAAAAAAMRELLDLKGRYAELQQKFANQTVTLSSLESELRELRRSLAKGPQDAEAPTPKSSPKAADGEEGAPEETELERLARELEAERFQGKSRALELQAAHESIDKLQEAMEQKQQMNSRLNKELGQAQARIRELEEQVRSLQAEIEKKDTILRELGTDVGKLVEQRDELERCKVTLARLRQQLISVANDGNRRVSELQNSLQAMNEFMGELKREYAEYMESSRREKEAREQKAAMEIERAQKELEGTRAAAFAEKRQLLAEQQEVLCAMQAQFDEYRTTAEFLFNTEGAKMEDRLNTLMLKYDAEIKFIIRSKDAQYDAMLMAKDAKIMNLIEGTDYQAQLIRHELEIDQLRKAHANDLDKSRAQMDEQHKKSTSALQRELQVAQGALDRMKDVRLEFEKRVQETHAALDRQVKEAAKREEQLAAQIKQQQRMLEQQAAELEESRQQKEHLRHAILRLKVEFRGEVTGTTESLVKRLAHETAVLNLKHEESSASLAARTKELQEAKRAAREARQDATIARHELDKRDAQLAALMATFEQFLRRRARDLVAKVVGPEPKAAFPPRPLSARTHTEFDDDEESTPQLLDRLTRLLNTVDRDGPVPPPTRPLTAGASPTIPRPGRSLREPSPPTTAAPAPDVQSSPVPPSGRKRRSRVVAARVPPTDGPPPVEAATVAELERGAAFLARFRALTGAFATGELKPQTNVLPADRADVRPLALSHAMGDEAGPVAAYGAVRGANAATLPSLSRPLYFGSGPVHDASASLYAPGRRPRGSPGRGPASPEARPPPLSGGLGLSAVSFKRVASGVGRSPPESREESPPRSFSAFPPPPQA